MNSNKPLESKVVQRKSQSPISYGQPINFGSIGVKTEFSEIRAMTRLGLKADIAYFGRFDSVKMSNCSPNTGQSTW